jgi:hypothetical protein
MYCSFNWSSNPTLRLHGKLHRLSSGERRRDSDTGPLTTLELFTVYLIGNEQLGHAQRQLGFTRLNTTNTVHINDLSELPHTTAPALTPISHEL